MSIGDVIGITGAPGGVALGDVVAAFHRRGLGLRGGPVIDGRDVGHGIGADAIGAHADDHVVVIDAVGAGDVSKGARRHDERRPGPAAPSAGLIEDAALVVDLEGGLVGVLRERAGGDGKRA